MADTESLVLVDQATGANNNTWGDVLDANFVILDRAIGVYGAISCTGGTVSLTDTQNQHPILDVTGILASNGIIEVKTRKKWWIVRNRTTGAFSLTVKTAAGTGIVVTQAMAALLYCDGTNVLEISNLVAAAAAASESAAGAVEKATDAETQTGTDNTRYVAPSSLTAKEATLANFLANLADRILTTDIVWSAATPVVLTDAATVAVDMSTFINATLAINGNRTLGQPSNTKVGQCGFIRITKTSAGQTLAYHADYKFAGGADPVLTISDTATDMLFFQVIAANFIYANLIKGVA